MDEFARERVLVAAELIPRGGVATYGDLARITHTSARFVGRVLKADGDELAWWRITNASGTFSVEELRTRAHEQWLAEAMIPSGVGLPLSRYRCDLEELASQYGARLREMSQTHDVPEVDQYLKENFD